MLQALTQTNFDEETASGTALVKFGAEWCGPCRMVKPVLKKMAADEAYAGTRFFEVDTDQNPDLAASFEIRGIPAFFVLQDGEVVAQAAGAKNETALAELIQTAIDK